MRNKISFWQALWYALSLFLLYVIVSQFGQLERVLEVLQRSNPFLILIVLFLQGLYYLNQAGAYQSLYAVAGFTDTFERLFPLSLATSFVSLATPTGSVGGITYFIQAQRQRGIPSGKSLFVSILYWLLDYLAVALVLVIGLTSLALRQDITKFQVIAAALMGALLLFLVISLILVVEAPIIPTSLARWLLTRADKAAGVLGKRIDVPRGLRAVDDFRGNLALVMKERNHLTRPLLHIIAGHVVNLVTLALLFVAFHAPLEGAVLISSYALILLFTIVSFTPSGLGFVETAGVFALSSQKIPPEGAVVIILTYRLMTFWIPLLVGYLYTRRLHLATKLTSIPFIRSNNR